MTQKIKTKAKNRKIVNKIKLFRCPNCLCKQKKEYVLSKQLLKCGTSIGANIAEANGAISKNDFSAKMSIAYKESLEVKYWVNLPKDTDYLLIEEFESLFADTDEIAKMLFSILKTTRINNC